MSFVAAAIGAVGTIGSSLLGSSSAPAPASTPIETNTTGAKTITFNNGLRLKDLQPLLLVIGIGGLAVFAVKMIRKK